MAILNELFHVFAIIFFHEKLNVFIIVPYELYNIVCVHPSGVTGLWNGFESFFMDILVPAGHRCALYQPANEIPTLSEVFAHAHCSNTQIQTMAEAIEFFNEKIFAYIVLVS